MAAKKENINAKKCAQINKNFWKLKQVWYFFNDFKKINRKIYSKCKKKYAKNGENVLKKRFKNWKNAEKFAQDDWKQKYI